MRTQAKAAKWMTPAILCAVPFLMLPVAITAPPARAQSVESELRAIRGLLVAGYKWRNAAGDVYLFKRDGHYQDVTGPGGLRGDAYARNYGTWRVRRSQHDDYLAKENGYTLELRITSSLRNRRFHKRGPAYIQRTAYITLPIRIVSSTRDDAADSIMIGRHRYLTVNR